MPLILFSFLLFVGCQKHDSDNGDLPPAGENPPPDDENPPGEENPPEEENDCYTKELKSLTFGFESENFIDDWIKYGGGVERKFEDDIQISSKTASEGNYSCKFRVSPESYVASGNRAELKFDQGIEEGDETFYEYSFYIPENYRDVFLKDDQNVDNYQMLGQWHDQPDKCLGEDWEDHPRASPPVAIHYGYFTLNDPEYVKILSKPEITSIHGFDPNWNEVSTIKLRYMNKYIAYYKISKGEWTRLRFHIKWSRSDDGFIQVWANGEELTNGRHYGANMLNKASHYFKFGLYRNASIPYTNEVYYDDIVVY